MQRGTKNYNKTISLEKKTQEYKEWEEILRKIPETPLLVLELFPKKLRVVCEVPRFAK